MKKFIIILLFIVAFAWIVSVIYYMDKKSDRVDVTDNNIIIEEKIKIWTSQWIWEGGTK